ncbi:MAG TPA: peptidase U62 [candidate division Zixibacteria bacterium]|nr:peptidase U62 [candidate division Zixibacteria bacterium]HEQ99400.1 peptidase U62 [candidate division Zixibacteria bacterium]
MRERTKVLRLAAACVLTLLFASPTFAATESELLATLQEELLYNFDKLKNADTVPLYYLSYQVIESQEYNVSAELGALESEDDSHVRDLDVIARVGSYELDNSREVPGAGGGLSTGAVDLPLGNDPVALKMKIWEETDRRYKEVQKQYTNVITGTTVKVEAEDQSDDFSREEPSIYIGDVAGLDYDRQIWEDKLVRYSSIFSNYPEIENSSVSLSARTRNSYLVTTEGTKIQDGQSYIRLNIMCSSTADDGMVLRRFEGFDAADFSNMPDDETVITAINRLIDELLALKSAPLAEPYTGPAILTGRASGVFFHEIFGHRMEGHRQKSESEGKTFTDKVGESVLPEFISVFSDPTMRTFNGIDLRGHYKYDDQGIEARRVTLVDKGILETFMLSRTPIENFPHSNGHGRKYVGFAPIARQANLIIESEKSVGFDELKEMLIEECKLQGKPYGLIFQDISGGFTFTGRFLPQAFKVIPLMVYKVYVEDGHEELIRGVDIVGTPLTSFSKIMIAGNDPDVFNGTCGAESGWVPVSAISPSLLLSEIEIERSQKGQERPPLLPSPLTKQQ